jgi:hypothetical protein
VGGAHCAGCNSRRSSGASLDTAITGQQAGAGGGVSVVGRECSRASVLDILGARLFSLEAKNLRGSKKFDRQFELHGSRNRLTYFWRLKQRIVGPLSESKISGSGFFIGVQDGKTKAKDKEVTGNGKLGTGFLHAGISNNCMRCYGYI